MELKDLVKEQSERYLGAFIGVCEMLAPNVTFNKVEDSRSAHESYTERIITLYGYNNTTKAQVKASTELLPNIGEHIVIKEKRGKKWKMVNKAWYFSFNWQGLEAVAYAEMS